MSANPIGTMPRIEVKWDDAGMHLVIEGEITPDHLIVAAHHIGRTADSIIDAMHAQEAQRQPRLAIARAMPGSNGTDGG